MHSKYKHTRSTHCTCRPDSSPCREGNLCNPKRKPTSHIPRSYRNMCKRNHTSRSSLRIWVNPPMCPHKHKDKCTFSKQRSQDRWLRSSRIILRKGHNKPTHKLRRDTSNLLANPTRNKLFHNKKQDTPPMLCSKPASQPFSPKCTHHSRKGNKYHSLHRRMQCKHNRYARRGTQHSRLPKAHNRKLHNHFSKTNLDRQTTTPRNPA
jgi:hypothetical protein